MTVTLTSPLPTPHRKSLQQHRLHKSPVKVEFYASAAGTSDLRQLLGYVVLDTRSAREKDPGAEVGTRSTQLSGGCASAELTIHQRLWSSPDRVM